MKTGLVRGLKYSQTYMTTLEMRAQQLIADVFSTPSMISLMEQTSVRLTEPYLDENEQSVGIHVDVRHTAATRIGQSVTITAEILEVKDGKIRFAVTATNDQGVRIGEGRHRRAVIDQKKFAGGASIAN
jgi:fluoroacetyl-CoA thioesterase